MLPFMSMNRQLRRAQDKQTKKLDREKEERRAERQKRLAQLRAQRDRRRQEAAARVTAGRSKGTSGSAPAAQPAGRNDPGRFSGALAAATVFFIILQAVVPSAEEGTLNSVIKAGFYLMLGYFLTLWLLRRNQPNAYVLSGIAGMILLTGTWLGFLLRPEAGLDGLSMLLSLPLLVLGIFLARFVFNLARSQTQG